LYGSTAAKYSEVQPDRNIVIIDHLNGATQGEKNGVLSFTSSLSGLDLAGDFLVNIYRLNQHEAALNLRI
jgi:hypothetical protein